MACLRSVSVPSVTRETLRLPCNTKAAEEEGEDPQAHAQRQVGWHKLMSIGS